MIKRRYYRVDRADKENDGTSDSSSDSEVEARSSDESDNEQADPKPEPEPASNVEADNNDDDEDEEEEEEEDRSNLRVHRASSSSSGYESEDSSANEIEADSGGLFANDDDSGSVKDGNQHKEPLFPRKENDELIETQAKDHPAVGDLPKCVLQSKSAFKCRLCPKIVCLNEESLKSHLKSKRHSRSEKLLKEGRLKRVLNSDGEEEVMSDDDGETHAERHARIIAMAQPSQNTSTKKSSGRQRQRQRLKRKKQSKSSNIPNSGEQKENRAKRRRKNAD